MAKSLKLAIRNIKVKALISHVVAHVVGGIELQNNITVLWMLHGPKALLNALLACLLLRAQLFELVFVCTFLDILDALINLFCLMGKVLL